MKRALILVAVASAIAGVTFGVLGRDGGTGQVSPSGTSQFVSGSDEDLTPAMERLVEGSKIDEDTESEVGTFGLGPGRTLDVMTAKTIDGKSCLVHEDPVRGSGMMCLEGGLFSLNRAAFSISSDGGPERFSELMLTGIAAPEITRVVVAKTNGKGEEVALNGEGAFVFQSTPDELKQDIVPAGLRLYGGRSGRLVEWIRIPNLR